MTVATPPNAPTAAGLTSSVGTVRRILLFISSPWMALTLLSVIFIHQAVGSAGFVIRQAFELNEMEWFNGWLSLLLWSLVCVCLATASMVRIPWRWSRAGAHLTHLGVISMVVSAAVYFSNKVEGEALLLRHYIDLHTATDSCRLLPNPGYSQHLGDAVATVDNILPTWMVLSPGGHSKEAWAAMVSVHFPDATPFTATLIENHPELTQYTVMGLKDTSYLPDYPGMIADQSTLTAVDARGKHVLTCPLRVRALTHGDLPDGDGSLEITNITPDFPLLSAHVAGQKGTMVEWTLKTPAGQENGSSIVGQPTLTRFLRARLKQVPDARLTSIELSPAPAEFGFHQNRMSLWIRRVGSPDDVEDPGLRSLAPTKVSHLALPGLPHYHDHGVHVGGKPMALTAGTVDGVTFTVTGFSPYADLGSRWTEDPTAPLRPLLVLDFSIDHDEEEPPINRLLPLSDDPAVLDDTPLCWLRAATTKELEAITARLSALFPAVVQDQALADDKTVAEKTRIALISGPDGAVTLWFGQPGHALTHQAIAVGQTATLHMLKADASVRLSGQFEHPHYVTFPIPTDPSLQESRSTVGNAKSMIEVSAHLADSRPSGEDEADAQRAWIQYSFFPQVPKHLGKDSPLSGFSPHPAYIDVHGAGTFEVEFGREPLPLPGPLWMTGFWVPRHAGSDDPSEYFCSVDYGGQGGAAGTASDQDVHHGLIHLNAPMSWHGFYFFQAGWDPNFQAYSVVGVGNRPAGAWLLGSAILLAIGMTWSGVSATRRKA